MEGRTLIYVLIMCVYLVLLVWFSNRGYKKSTTLSDFVAGGHDIGLWVSIALFTATWVSAASVIGFPSMTFRDGLCSLTAIYGGYFFANSLMPIAAYKLRRPEIPARTIPEFLRFRYEPNVKRSPLQAIGSLGMLIGYLAYVMIQVKAVGMIVASVTGFPYILSILVVMIFIIYTAAGGMWSVGLGDLVNTATIVITLVIAAIIVLVSAGGWSHMWEVYSTINTPPIEGSKPTPPGQLLSMLGPYSFSFVMGLFIASSLGGMSAPHWLGRMQMPRNVKTAVITPLYSQIIILVIYMALLIIGVGGRVIIPTIPAGHDADWLLPMLFTKHLPAVIGALALSGVLAAALSTANGMLLHQALALNYDVVRNLTKKKISDDVFIKWNRYIIIAFGVIAVILAIKPPKLIAIVAALAHGFWGCMYLFPVVLGVYWKRYNRVAAYWSCIAGPIAYVVMHLLIKGKYISGVIPEMVWGLGVALIGSIILSYAFPPAPKAGWEGYFEENISDETRKILLAAQREMER